MDDEQVLREVDARVRAALDADGETVRRIVGRALADAPAADRGRASRYGLAAAVLVAASIVIAGVWQWRRAPSSPSLSVVGRGSTVIVESADGRRWMIGPQQPRTGGNYVIAVSEQ